MEQWKMASCLEELLLTPGERGCAASHVMAWRRCSACRKPMLVLEVDALDVPDLSNPEMRKVEGGEIESA